MTKIYRGTLGFFLFIFFPRHYASNLDKELTSDINPVHSGAPEIARHVVTHQPEQDTQSLEKTHYSGLLGDYKSR